MTQLTSNNTKYSFNNINKSLRKEILSLPWVKVILRSKDPKKIVEMFDLICALDIKTIKETWFVSPIRESNGEWDFYNPVLKKYFEIQTMVRAGSTYKKRKAEMEGDPPFITLYDVYQEGLKVIQKKSLKVNNDFTVLIVRGEFSMDGIIADSDVLTPLEFASEINKFTTFHWSGSIALAPLSGKTHYYTIINGKIDLNSETIKRNSLTLIPPNQKAKLWIGSIEKNK